jgi:DNA-binding response OmpR family regulator/DNA-binding CsgD family transcriptional regulator
VADGKHILVVEDEVDLANLVQVNLDLAGYAVTVARDGAEGLAAIRRERPDLVLLDVMMPVLDGWQVLRAIEEDAALRGLPVIMLTALSEERDIIRGHLQGAVRYVTKPFEMQVLLRTVEEGIAEPDAQELATRRGRVRQLLRRLAELDSGRSASGSHVRFSKLEAPPVVGDPRPEPTAADRSKLDQLTDKQRYIAGQLGAGRSARDLAEELDVSRSNVYATRKRIGRKLGVHPDLVADEAQRLGLAGRSRPRT